MKLKTHKVLVSYAGKELTEGTIVRFRNGQHTNGTSPAWGPWLTGAVSGIYDRAKLLRDMPAGINYFGIAGAHIEFNVKAWDETHRQCDAEEFILHIPELSVAVTKSY